MVFASWIVLDGEYFNTIKVYLILYILESYIMNKQINLMIM